MPLTASHLFQPNLKYKQHLAKKKELVDMPMDYMSFDIPSLEELMTSHLAELMIISTNYCGYSVTLKI